MTAPQDAEAFPAGRELLVTGAGGFIGQHLSRHLAEAGGHVRALDLLSRPSSLPAEGLRYLRADVRHRESLATALAGVDTVFHLASVHLEVGASPEAFEAVNVDAVGALVELCSAAGVRRLVHCSSVGIYGHVEDPPAAEDCPKAPQTPYEKTKLAGERVALARGRELGFDVVVVRPAWVYGPGCPRTAKLLSAVRKRRFLFVGDGSNLRHPIYVGDMVRGFLAAAAADSSVAGEAFIIAGPRALSLRDMVETCARVVEVPPPRLRMPRALALALGTTLELAGGVLGREPPFSRRSLAFFENDNAFDTRKASDRLGFHPEVDFEEGLRRTLDAAAGSGLERPVA